MGLFSLGGEATVELASKPDEAEAIINRAIDLGVNYIDTAPAYGSGGSETNIGRVMAYRRDEVFLATKTADRTYDGTMRLLEQSLNRLQTDHLDLYQLHNVRLDRDVEQALGPGGAVQAMEQMKEQGVIKNIGITGHRDPTVLLTAIREYRFDCVLMALNAADPHYNSFRNILLPEAVERDMGIIAMKVTARGRIFDDGCLTSMGQDLTYVLSLPVSTTIVGISTLEELEEDVAIARRFEALSTEEMQSIEQLTASNHEAGNFFKLHW